MKKMLIFSAIILLLPLLALLALHLLLTDYSYPLRPDFRTGNGQEPFRVMAIFPHPDDELSVAAALASCRAQGAEIGLLVLTKGEAGRTGGLTERATLGQVREREVRQAAQLLGVSYIAVTGLPDSGMEQIPPDSIRQLIAHHIEQFNPTVVFTYDEQVGLYGHPDHRLTARYVSELFRQGNTSVQRVYGVTLPPRTIWLALQVSSAFQRRYPKEPGQGLPLPEFAVQIEPYGQLKHDMIACHQTQWEVLGDLQPMRSFIPGWLYYRIFSREYYFEVKK